MNGHPFIYAVVTAANGGLGLETARALAAAGARVVMAARSPDKTAAAVDTIRAETPSAQLDVVVLDLASLDAVRAAAATILERHPAIDVLVNNAGLMGLPVSATVDGNEMQFGVNLLGHFLLTNRRLPVIAAVDGRVVTVTSTAHHIRRRVDPAAGSAVARLLAHPGLSNTDLQTHSVAATDGGRSQRSFAELAHRTGMPPSRGVLPQLRAATDAAAHSRDFYAPRWVNIGPRSPDRCCVAWAPSIRSRCFLVLCHRMRRRRRMR